MDKMITTIIAHFNYEEFLPNAVRSAEEQTYPNHICVIDDGSNIEIDELIKKMFRENEVEEIKSLNEHTVVSSPNKTLIYLKNNVGPSLARNIGIEYMWDKTDAYMILDADDIMMENKIALLVSEMKKDWDNIGAVYADYYILDTETGNRTSEYKKPYDKRLLNFECIVHSGSLVNKKALEDCGSYDPTLRTCEDFDLWRRISTKYMIRHVPEFLTLVLNHPNNSTRSLPKEIWEENFKRVVNG